MYPVNRSKFCYLKEARHPFHEARRRVGGDLTSTLGNVRISGHRDQGLTTSSKYKVLPGEVNSPWGLGLRCWATGVLNPCSPTHSCQAPCWWMRNRHSSLGLCSVSLTFRLGELQTPGEALLGEPFLIPGLRPQRRTSFRWTRDYELVIIPTFKWEASDSSINRTLY